MTAVLSQEEIDQLLTAINAGFTEEPDDFRPRHDTRKIKIYDFKRPDKFSKEQIRTLVAMHESFARLSTAHLSSYLSSMAHIHVASVDQLTYEEFIRSIPTPTTLAIINMDPLKGNAVLEIDPAITFSLIDRLFGGSGEGIKCQHELTDIETSIMEEIIVRLLGSLRESWSNVIDLRPRLGQIDTNPQFVQIVPPTEMVVLITLEAKIGEIEGMINFCIPYLTIESIINRLSIQYWYKSVTNSEQEDNPTQIDIQDIPIVLAAELFNRICTAGEINRWKKNKTVIYPHEKMEGGKCVIKVDDFPIFLAGIEKSSEIYNRKIKITEILNPYKERKMADMVDLTSGAKLGDAKGVAGILNDVNMEVSVELGRTRRMVKDILGMGEGTIVELDALAGEPVSILANGKAIARGEVVVIDENFGVRITELLTQNQNP